MMPLPHPIACSTYVRYFYLPASNDRYAEVIEVLNSNSDTVKVPMREEDVELEAFFVRPLSGRELEAYKKAETWKLFNSWEELKQDHFRFDLPDELLEHLLRFKGRFELHEEMTA
ncbi:hypothetical protein [Pontibacter anaerobius]|uniref:Uncharacterized protein n=1 Tax=Pontibacter anaerobius TaxID=2993940 RepID=A0ABT3R9X1_9BACT|nr:hypothetical protein [Pontibacter anaerobius]MCX2738638.1 hypothetical protein [Pontibacter anaerobius]